MPSSTDILEVKSIALERQSRDLAIGMNLGKLSGILVQAGDETAPHFAQGREPASDAPSFTAVDGHVWYRPDLRVADRPSSIGPYVWLLKDSAGVVRLEFVLDELGPGGLPDGATPFAVTIDSLQLKWSDADGA